MEELANTMTNQGFPEHQGMCKRDVWMIPVVIYKYHLI